MSRPTVPVPAASAVVVVDLANDFVFPGGVIADAGGADYQARAQAIVPTLVRLLRPCTFRALTGWPCPTCGTTRAALAVLAGDLGAAWAASPLATLAFLSFLGGGLVAPLWVWAGGPLPSVTPSGWRRLAVLALLAVLVNWAVLLATC